MGVGCRILLLGLLFLAAAGAARGAERGLLVVAPEAAWIDAAAPLLDLRRAQGWRVSAEVLFRPDAHALGSLVARSRAADPALSHVLLLGSDRTLPMARRPNLRIQGADSDVHGFTDDPYGTRGPDGVPQIAVGRIPFDNVWGIGRIAQKTLRYEAERGALSSEVLLIVGRIPASREKALGLMSPQVLADQAVRSILTGCLEQVRRLEVRVRTAFDGPGAFSFAEAPGMLAEELERRPWLWVYAGHAWPYGLSTFHSLSEPDSIKTADLFGAGLTEVTGPFISTGCSMAAPSVVTSPFVNVLLVGFGGPPGAAVFTGVNEDFWVAQWLQGLMRRVDELTAPTTLGDLILQSKRDMVAAPQSDLSVLVEQFMRSTGQLNPGQAPAYDAVVRRNNELLVILGDPCLSLGGPGATRGARE